jgi:hypothetical protein
MVGTTQAASKGGNKGDNKGGNSGHVSHNYHIDHGSRMRDGRYFYRGRDHHHWTYRYWYGRYGCYCYYCPSTCCWYYWYQKDDCYYPVSYINTATPVFERAPVGVETDVKQIVNVTNNSPGAATAGAGGPGAGPVMPPAPPRP